MSMVKYVPGVGLLQSLVMLVGESPGAAEEDQGKPFVGASGDLLNEALARISWQRDDLYITNVVKVRPPDNRTPNMDEVESWKPVLFKEVETIAPLVIVAMGSTAIKAFDERMRVTRDQGKLTNMYVGKHKCLVVPVFHPSYVLRGYTSKDEWFKTWEKIQNESGM